MTSRTKARRVRKSARAARIRSRERWLRGRFPHWPASRLRPLAVAYADKPKGSRCYSWGSFTFVRIDCRGEGGA